MILGNDSQAYVFALQCALQDKLDDERKLLSRPTLADRLVFLADWIGLLWARLTARRYGRLEIDRAVVGVKLTRRGRR